MKTLGIAILSIILTLPAIAQDLSLRAWQMETKGDAVGARELLEKSAQAGGFDGVHAYAEFLDRHRDPAARVAYEKALGAAPADQRASLARRLVVLDLIAGDREAAQR